jgi:hypothetical protein
MPAVQLTLRPNGVNSSGSAARVLLPPARCLESFMRGLAIAHMAFGFAGMAAGRGSARLTKTTAKTATKTV